jgi:hypothetical protein
MQQVADLKTSTPLNESFDNVLKDKLAQENAINLNENILPKTQFQIDCERGYSVEELRANMHKRLAKLWESKK